MSTKYFPTIRDPFKAPYLHQKVYKVDRAYNDQGGIFHPEATLVLEPDGLGRYVVENYGDRNDKGELTELGKMAELKYNCMLAHVKASKDRIIGPYDTPEEAAIAERKKRPKTEKEKLAAAEYEIVELKRKLADKGKDK